MAKPDRPPEVKERRRTPPPSHPREREGARHVADARLSWLLSLPPDELDTLYRAERRQLRALGERAARIRHEFRCGRWTSHEATQRLNELARRTPSLLTAGVQRGSKGRPRTFDFSVLLLTTADHDRMRSAGLRVRSAHDVEFPGHSGPRLRVVSALASAAALDAVARNGMARAIHLARPWRASLDTAVPEAQLDGMKRVYEPITGRGVVIGVIDLAPLDFYHLDFRKDEPGNPTRVKFLWDQQLDAKDGGHAPAPGGLLGPDIDGVEYSEADINNELLGFKPGTQPAYKVVRHEPPAPPVSALESHGTTVASCAAGNGLASARRYRGGAPDADIIYVRLKALDPMNALTGHANVLDAFAYIFTRAAALNQPCVVNMSLGDLQGAHDGNSLGERFLEGLLAEPGRAITVPAGNFNGDWRHAAGTVQQDQEEIVKIEFGGGAKKSDAIELWYPASDRFEASFVLPDGVTVVGPVVPEGVEQVDLGNGVKISLVSTLAGPLSTANCVAVYVSVEPGAKIPTGTWRLRLKGTQVVGGGAFQAWIDRNNKYANFREDHRVEDQGTLGVPGTARGVITVGAQRKGQPEVAAFSGRGPTRDGRAKPDLIAVGTSLTAATAVNRNLAAPGSPEYRGGNNGTSYAAPLAAAACALLFECLGPNTTCAQIMAELRTRAILSADGADRLLQVGLTCL
jgi:hypothetical protein